jgi:hypothetical protein
MDLWELHSEAVMCRQEETKTWVISHSMLRCVSVRNGSRAIKRSRMLLWLGRMMIASRKVDISVELGAE